MPNDASHTVYLTDGTFDFADGVDSSRVPTVQSTMTPNGLPRSGLAWLVNGTVRNGGVYPRFGWQPLGTVHDSTGLYQGGIMYDNPNGNPYLILSISGHIWYVDPDFNIAPVDLSVAFGLVNPANQVHSYFVQAEEFVVIQAGDLVTLPLFWDGATLWRSRGLTPPYPQTAQLPPATAMDYYMGRIWYAFGRNYAAGDIVGGPSGTLPYAFRDSVLNVTENPLAVGGDGFAVPASSGNIRALSHESQLDASLGQGRLLIGTRKDIYALTVPITRTDWIGSDNNNQPLQVVAQRGNGTVNERSIAAVNSDLFFQSLEPGIRSYVAGVRYFGTWNNRPISSNEDRILSLNNRALMHAATGIFFNNRLLQGVLPVQTDQGVVHKAILPLDMDPISSFGVTAKPAWEGHYEGLNTLQLFTADFGGRERGFMATVSSLDSSIQIWEMSESDRFENGDNRITWILETPAFTWGREFDLKRLVSLELWIDRLWGTVEFEINYRPDSYPCWTQWHRFSECAARNPEEDSSITPSVYPAYPLENNYREQDRASRVLPMPPAPCNRTIGRPMNVGFQFQLQLKITGWCRLRGLLLKAERVDKALYNGMVCP